MNDDKTKSDARPIFRRAAGLFGVVCLLLALVFSGLVGVARDDGALRATAAMGVILLVIARTGKGPWSSK
jgi:hypothetical protein